MITSDLTSVKLMLDIPPNNNTENAKLNFILESASNWIEEILDRQLFRKSRTEYYWGQNTNKLLLKARPVLTTPALQVYVDGGGNFGASSGSFASGTLLTYGTDYCLDLDSEDGTQSKSGILIRIGSVWHKKWVRSKGLLTPYMVDNEGSIKVIYTGGYTYDNLPPLLRTATEFLIAKMYATLPLGMEIGSESYEERSISFQPHDKHYLTSMVRPMLISFYRNWSF